MRVFLHRRVLSCVYCGLVSCFRCLCADKLHFAIYDKLYLDGICTVAIQRVLSFVGRAGGGRVSVRMLRLNSMCAVICVCEGVFLSRNE